MAEDMYDPNNPFFLYDADMLCAICTKKLEADKSCSLTKPIHDNSTIKAYEVLQSISQFKYKLSGPQNVCAVCFKNVASTCKFQQICNKAQELFNKFTQYQGQSSEDMDVTEPEMLEVQISENTPSDASPKSVQTIKVTAIDKPYKCMHCEATFNSRNARQFHVNLHERTHVCSYCDRALGSKSKLEVHERTHTGERPFPCEHCDWAFKTKEGLQHHTLIHTKERPWICEVCTKAFNRRSTLRKHLAIHTGIRPHACPECERAFKDSHSLKSHLKVHEKKRNKDSGMKIKKVARNIKQQLIKSDDEDTVDDVEEEDIVEDDVEGEDNEVEDVKEESNHVE